MAAHEFENGRRWRFAGYRKAERLPCGKMAVVGCERCGQSIVHIVTMEATDGTRLTVGMDCAATLEGGPELQEIRAAIAAEKRAAAMAEWNERGRAERDARAKFYAAEAARNAVIWAVELAECDEVCASPRTSDFAKKIAGDIARGLRNGTRSYGYRLEDRNGRELRSEAGVMAQAILDARSAAPKHADAAPGDRVELDVVCTLSICIGESFFNGRSVSRYLVKFAAADGTSLTWFTSGPWELLWRGRIRATVDSHGDYHGEPQTLVKRVQEAPPPRAKAPRKPRARKAEAA